MRKFCDSDNITLHKTPQIVFISKVYKKATNFRSYFLYSYRDASFSLLNAGDRYSRSTAQPVLKILKLCKAMNLELPET